jgi:hypothetical protein
MTRDEYGDKIIESDSPFILVGDYEEFCMKNIIDPAMEKHAADLGVTMSEFKKLLAEDAKEGAIMGKHADELGVTLREYKSMLAGDTMEEAMKKEHKRMLAEGAKGRAMKKSVHPMSTQVGGEWYKNKGVQPLEATYQNYGLSGLEAAVFTKVNKYFRDKAGLEKKLDDCKKAQHVLQIFQEKLEAEVAKEKFEESYNRNR